MSWSLEERVTHVETCIEEVDYANYLLQNATTISTLGHAASKLADAVHDLKTWHRFYNESNGMLPWEMNAE